MATARGRCDVDHTSARFGDCATAVGAAPSVTCGVVWVWAVVLVVEAGGGAGASWNWRAVVLNVAVVVVVRFGSCRAAAAATPRRRETYIVWVVVGVGELWWWWFCGTDPRGASIEVQLDAARLAGLMLELGAASGAG
jgi:hypothetical protein